MAENLPNTNPPTLLPCPFCGEPGYLVGLGKFFVACAKPGCEAEGPVKVSATDAADSWNVRATIPAPDVEAAALRAATEKFAREERLALLRRCSDVVDTALENGSPRSTWNAAEEAVNAARIDALCAIDALIMEKPRAALVHGEA